ncbi:GAF domain-containing protein [Streptomyces sp. NPDC046915]|uniref:GAF domain-containing protein n=1 Tax=Streptomyces sp. NPDC046915 TaxID=3155257 RepID=UPI0033E84410
MTTSRERELEELLDATLQLSGQDDVQGLLDVLVNRARTLVRADTSHLDMLDPEREEIRVAAMTGAATGSPASVRMPLADALSASVFESARPHRALCPAEAGTDRRWLPDPRATPGRIASVVGIPLRSSGGVRAVLLVGWRGSHRVTTTELDLLDRLGDVSARRTHSGAVQDGAGTTGEAGAG